MSARITPFLWFDAQAEAAAKFYCSIFKNSRIGRTTRYSEGSPGPAGSVMTVEFTLDGSPFIALNGGPHFKFSEAVSFVVDCKDQKEVDYYWDRLLAGGGEPSRCGWLRDRYGLSWQVVPQRLDALIAAGGPTAKRVMDAMLRMVKIDVATLDAAAGLRKAPARKAARGRKTA